MGKSTASSNQALHTQITSTSHPTPHGSAGGGGSGRRRRSGRGTGLGMPPAAARPRGRSGSRRAGAWRTSGTELGVHEEEASEGEDHGEDADHDGHDWGGMRP